MLRIAVAAATAALGLAVPAAGQNVENLAEEVAAEQSCRALAGGTVGVFDEGIGHTVDSPDAYPVEPAAGVPTSWALAPAELGLPLKFPLRSTTETFNRRYSFVLRGGRIYVRSREDATSPWREMPLPACFAGRVSAISVDDDEMIALDQARRVYTMDNALKGGVQFNWSSRWGAPVWTGPGYQLPRATITWSWSVISPAEDETWTDPAGNHPRVGRSKVSHIWGLRRGGQRLTFWDPWLPLDESYEMCGPHRGRFRAVDLSASGSYVFVVGRRGDLFTRLYDFDISGHNSLFSYSYDDQTGKGDNAPIQLPAARWVEQPKIPGRITSAISIHKVGTAAIHRILRVEGRSRGTTGYWERDTADDPSKPWGFHRTGLPLTGRRLTNPRRDTSRVGLGPSATRRYRHGRDWIDFNLHCSRSRVRADSQKWVLHHVDGLRQQARARGLDDVPREQYAALARPDGSFQRVTLLATRNEIRVDDLGWVFRRPRK